MCDTRYKQRARFDWKELHSRRRDTVTLLGRCDYALSTDADGLSVLVVRVGCLMCYLLHPSLPQRNVRLHEHLQDELATSC